MPSVINEFDPFIAPQPGGAVLRKAWVGWWVDGRWCPTSTIRDFAINRRRSEMGLHVLTEEIIAEFAGFPIEGVVMRSTKGHDDEPSTVEVAIGTGEERDDGAVGSWLRINAESDRLVRVFRELADAIENGPQASV